MKNFDVNGGGRKKRSRKGKKKEKWREKDGTFHWNIKDELWDSERGREKIEDEKERNGSIRINAVAKSDLDNTQQEKKQ